MVKGKKRTWAAGEGWRVDVATSNWWQFGFLLSSLPFLFPAFVRSFSSFHTYGLSAVGDLKYFPENGDNYYYFST